MLPKAALAVLIGIIISADATILLTGAHRARDGADERRRQLLSSLRERSRSVSGLQRQSDESRTAVFSAMDALTEVLDLARSFGGIDDAQAKWPAATALMEAARRGRDRLPSVTDQILKEATSASTEADRLKNLTQDRLEIDYLASLARALDLLAETHVAYGKMNAKIIEGMRLFEELFMLTDEFLEKERSRFFRSRAQAADYYTLETERGNLAAEIDRINNELSGVEQEAAAAAGRTEAAFADVQSRGARLR